MHVPAALAQDDSIGFAGDLRNSTRGARKFLLIRLYWVGAELSKSNRRSFDSLRSLSDCLSCQGKKERVMEKTAQSRLGKR